MEKIYKMVEHFRGVEAADGHSGYFYSVGETLAIVMLGSLCGLKNANQIHQWASNERTNGFLRENFRMGEIPCCYWMLCLLKLTKPGSLNRCFVEWAASLVPADSGGGLRCRSTGKPCARPGKCPVTKGPCKLQARK